MARFALFAVAALANAGSEFEGALALKLKLKSDGAGAADANPNAGAGALGQMSATESAEEDWSGSIRQGIIDQHFDSSIKDGFMAVIKNGGINEGEDEFNDEMDKFVKNSKLVLAAYAPEDKIFHSKFKTKFIDFVLSSFAYIIQKNRVTLKKHFNQMLVDALLSTHSTVEIDRTYNWEGKLIKMVKAWQRLSKTIKNDTIMERLRTARYLVGSDKNLLASIWEREFTKSGRETLDDFFLELNSVRKFDLKEMNAMKKDIEFVTSECKQFFKEKEAEGAASQDAKQLTGISATVNTSESLLQKLEQKQKERNRFTKEIRKRQLMPFFMCEECINYLKTERAKLGVEEISELISSIRKSSNVDDNPTLEKKISELERKIESDRKYYDTGSQHN